MLMAVSLVVMTILVLIVARSHGNDANPTLTHQSQDGSLEVVAKFLEPEQRTYRGTGIWEDAVRKAPNNPRARAGYAQVLEASGNWREALEQYGKVYELSFRDDISPSVAEMTRLQAQLNIVNIYQTIGNDKAAEAMLMQAWQENHGFPGFAVGLSYYNMRRGAYPEALSIADEGISHLGDYPASAQFFAGKLYWNRGAVHQMMGDCAKANADYRLAQKFPDIPKIAECRA